MKTQSEVMKEVDESFKKDLIGDEVEAAIRKLQDEAEAETKDKMQYSGQLCTRPIPKNVYFSKMRGNFFNNLDREMRHQFYTDWINRAGDFPQTIDEINNKEPNGAEPNPQTLADVLSEPIDPIKLEMEREAIAQRCIAFSRQQAGVTSAANIYDAYVAKNLVRLLTWHFDACKHPGSELADLSFEKIRKVGEI